jgi:hypothetical protein
MNLSIVSFNGTSLNDSSFEAYFPNPSVMAGPEGEPGFVERSYFGPVFTYKKRKPRVLPIHIKMKGTVASDVDTLKALFNPYSDEEYKLLAADLNDSSKQYYVYGTPISIPDVDGQEMVVNLWVADPVWKTETETEVEWAVTTDGDQESITVGGSFYSEPTFEIIPTAAKSGGKAYRVFCPVYNPSTTITYTDNPLDIVDDGLDTEALIADATTYVLINDGSGITDADVTIDVDGEVGDFPTSGLAYVGTEQISYTGYAAGQLTGCTRGVNGTSAAAHGDDDPIYASRMEADGGDIQVLVDGIAVNYWLQDINDATTQVWINANLSPGYSMTNGVLIADSGDISTITLENTTANIDAINALPGNGRLLIDSELFSYTGKNVTTRQFTGVTREAFNTTAAEHTVGDDVWWIEHEIYIYHGVHDLPSFTVDDDYKPCLELDSTNAEWTYDSTFFKTDALSLTTGIAGWYYAKGTTYSTGSSPYVHRYYESMSTSDPETQTGTSNKTFSVIGEWAKDLDYAPLNYGFLVTIQAGFTHVAATGKKWYSSTAGTDWFAAPTTYGSFGADNAWKFHVTAPSVADTIESWSQSTLDLGGTFYTMHMAFYRDFGDRDHKARIEADTFVFTIDATQAPVAGAGASNEYYHINSSLVNTTTGDYIDIDYYCNLNAALIISTADHTVVDNDSGAYARGAIQLSSYRHDWLKMIPGANVLEWDETGATGLTINVKRRERKL